MDAHNGVDGMPDAPGRNLTMATTRPETTLDQRFSSEDATPVAWATAQPALEQAGISWLSTVRPDGRPHVTPLMTVWHDDALHFCTGEAERKNLNLIANDQCILTTGCNDYNGGLDIVVEGRAERILDREVLQVLAVAWEAKYGADWHFEVGDGGFQGVDGHGAWVYRVTPVTAFGFGRGAQASQTRWRF
jgi:general stress protein 26